MSVLPQRRAALEKAHTRAVARTQALRECGLSAERVRETKAGKELARVERELAELAMAERMEEVLAGRSGKQSRTGLARNVSFACLLSDDDLKSDDGSTSRSEGDGVGDDGMLSETVMRGKRVVMRVLEYVIEKADREALKSVFAWLKRDSVAFERGKEEIGFWHLRSVIARSYYREEMYVVRATEQYGPVGFVCTEAGTWAPALLCVRRSHRGKELESKLVDFLLDRSAAADEPGMVAKVLKSQAAFWDAAEFLRVADSDAFEERFVSKEQHRLDGPMASGLSSSLLSQAALELVVERNEHDQLAELVAEASETALVDELVAEGFDSDDANLLEAPDSDSSVVSDVWARSSPALEPMPDDMSESEPSLPMMSFSFGHLGASPPGLFRNRAKADDKASLALQASLASLRGLEPATRPPVPPASAFEYRVFVHAPRLNFVETSGLDIIDDALAMQLYTLTGERLGDRIVRTVSRRPHARPPAYLLETDIVTYLPDDHHTVLAEVWLSGELLYSGRLSRLVSHFNLVALAMLATVALAAMLSQMTQARVTWKATTEDVAGNSELIIDLVVGGKAGGAEALFAYTTAVSTPGHELYGMHLSAAAVSALYDDIDAIAATVAIARKALADGAIGEWSVSRRGASSFVRLHLTAQDAHLVTDCQLKVFVPHGPGADVLEPVIRCAEGRPMLRHGLRELVLTAGGLTRMVAQPLVAKTERGLDAVDDALVIDPHVLRKQYGVDETMGNASPKTTQAVAQFLKQYMSKADLDEFFLIFADYAIGTHPTIRGPNHAPPGTEATLDIQYIMSVAAKVNTTFWSTGGTHANQEPFLEWLGDVAADPAPPMTFSVSYGDVEASIEPSYVLAVNAELAKLGARGVSVLFASGDSGVGCDAAGTAFSPTFPAGTPWVTAVGGTRLTDKGEVVNGLSTGGFSNIFPRPDYQAAAVAHYLGSSGVKLPPASYYNATSRGFPDVAALSSGFSIVLDFVPLPGMIAGTSCAAPTFSAVVSLLNDARLAAGKPPLGFLNPFLYQTAASCGSECFFDVVEGGNPDQAGGCDGQCFFAAPGWDPTTGLGTPKYAGLVKAALAA
ncbi:uncharacterized protein AMSG_11940 [Thecamonas trahens ATCC 50062]|uniref:Peptidase S53 domain-containing protein n=1 Tax=Thecamonas trahens ATCC 50062 TaxID=461836 RepID=A0A0L0DET8_THETB|nr:hypothetical protein AMSG_11940 [Thecamonas trahens ATCC 50062]KNC49838.1 hypothetical protein AMSG_11940 [Thecamonas trahens ATCC 50062]|eukprot:XP_013757440.1 hypothetical protein AMSG_11940 [Thecamonas trahens ATCC 50062]